MFICEINAIVSATRRRRYIKMLLRLSGPVQKNWIIVGNDHKRIFCFKKSNFSDLDRKYPLWANLIQKIKLIV